MGFKAIKQHYDIGYIVAIYNEEKYGGDCICIGSGFVHGLIAINIETGKVFYSSLVTPGENSEIGQLAARICQVSALLACPPGYRLSCPFSVG